MKFCLSFLLLLTVFSKFAKSQTVPNINLVNLDGKNIAINNFISNTDKPIVLSFWATWCVPCINELSIINDQYNDLQKQYGFKLYAIAVDDSRTAKRIQPMVNGKNWDFDVLHDQNQELKRQLNIMNIPYTVVVKNGKVIYRHSGYVAGDEDELINVISTNQ